MPAIRGMLKQDGLEKLIVVNNGNPEKVEAALEALAKEHDALSIVSGHGNVGFSKGCNIGAKELKSEFLCFVNPDLLLADGALATLQRALENDDSAAMAGPRLLYPNGKEQAGGRRNLLTPDTAMNEALGWHLITGNAEGELLNLHKEEESGKSRVMPAISGACMMIRRKEFEAINGFDEGYFLHVEDLDLCFRLHEAGKTILYVPEVEVIHAASTSDMPNYKVEWWKFKSFCRYFRQHFRKNTPRWKLLAVMTGGLLRYALKVGAGPIMQWRHRAYHRSMDKALHRYVWFYRQLWLEKAEPLPFDASLSPVFVSGASTAIATALMCRLLAAGVEVIAMHRQPHAPFTHPKLHWVQGDLEADELPYQGRSPMVFVHTAPIWSLKPSHITQFANAGGKHILAFSSTSIEGKEDSYDAEELRTVRNLEQGESNVMTACDRLGIAWTIFRPTLIYGLGMDNNVSSIARFVRSFGFFPLNNPSDGKRQPVHADDLAQAVMQAAGNDASYKKCYALTGGETLPYRMMVERVVQSTGKQVNFWVSPYLPMIMDGLSFMTGSSSISGDIARRMNKDLEFDSSEAANDFGYAPRMFQLEGIV